VNDFLDSKKGSSAEINYLLLSMLTSAGIQGEPVLVSTRDHGQLWEVYPLLSQFNHVIARATIGGRTYFLDATDPHRPMNLLPSDVLGVRGLVVQPKKTEWVTIASPAKSISALAARILIDGNGAIRGSIEGRYENYINLSVRKDLKDKKQNDVVKDLFKLDGSGLSLDSAQVNNTDSISSSTVIKAWISSDSYVQTGGDLLYLNPHLVRRWTDNIFKSEARKFPVDYNYPREYSTTVTITLPDTLEVKEVLQNRRISVEGNVIYMREMAIDSPQIILTTKLNVISKVVPARHYKSLKDLYATMISTEGEQLILQKKPKPVVVPEPIKVESKKTPDMPKKIKVKR
jgi:hypothetical protein